ncbi:MAG: hypothetical protein RIQ93_3052 [Verrucomicrobiota bacterium]|jgi:endonuclease/exonuclease/phosphatase family metal-dependent hydrolase
MNSPRRFASWVALAGLAVLRLPGETLVVATYNVENYGPADRMTEVGFRKDYPKPEVEKQALRRVIKRMDADVLVLQEMGGASHLDELRRDLKTEGLDYPFGAVAAAADEDRHVALVSKRPLRDVTTHRELQFSYFGAKERVKRGVLEATVVTGRGDLTIFAIHLKSRFTDRADDPLSAVRRRGEGTAIRDLVLQRFPAPRESRFLILGDCNDGRSSRVVEQLQKRGKTRISFLLPAEDSRGEKWTHLFRREETYSRVDHIFVSPGLLAAVRGGSARIVDGDGVGEASDHRPVMVSVRLDQLPLIGASDQSAPISPPP